MKKTLLILIAFVSITACNSFQEKGVTGRHILSLSGNWKFCIDSLNKGLSDKWYQTGLPHNLSKKISVPHTWNANPATAVYLGKAWYSKKFSLNDSLKGNKIRLKFDAVYHDAYIYLNGHKIFEHIGSGYTPFTIEISQQVIFGAENTLTVLTDNSFSKSSIPYMNSYDWSADGGIIRDVTLIITGNPAVKYMHIIAKPNLENRSGSIKILVKHEENNLKGNLRYVFTFFKDNPFTGVPILEKEFDKPNNIKDSFDFEFKDINLWHFDHPNLYKVEMKVFYKKILVDNISSSFGFRKFDTKGDKIFLNGESVRLMAVEWMPGSSLKNGMAETKVELFENLERIKDVNCVLTRFHWQQDESVLDWCDRNGLMVQEEIPVWGNIMPPYNDTILNLSVFQLNEMINAHFNHPSIVMWGIGNEYSKDKTSELMQKLYSYCKKLDHNRLVTYVSNSLHKNLKNDPTALVGDIMMWNNYVDTWYGMPIEKAADILDEIHKAIPTKPLMISEYGLCEPFHKGGDERRVKQLITYNNFYNSRPWIVGAIYFDLNDYRTHMGEEGEGVLKQRVHGVYDIYNNPKPSKEVLKNISAPLEIQKIKRNNENLEITISCKNIIPSYSCKNYYLTISNEENVSLDENVIIPPLKPGESKIISAKTKLVNKGFINIFRPNGQHVASKVF